MTIETNADVRARWLPWFAWATAAAFFFYAWILRVSPSVLVNELMSEFSVGGAIVGHLSALYFYGYSGMQLPVGLLIDKFGPRRPMTLAAVICAVGALSFAASETLTGLSVSRFFIGVGAAFSFMCAIHIAARWLPPARFAMLVGLAMMAGMAGGVFGQAPISIAVEQFGWRETLFGTGLAGLIIAVCAWATVRDERVPRRTDQPSQADQSSQGVFAGLRAVIRERQNWFNAVAGLGATGPLLGFGALWGVPYLHTALDISRPHAAGLASLTLIGWGIGAPTFGWLSDRLSRRREPFLVGIVICSASLMTIIHALPQSHWAVGALCFLVGFGGSSQIVNFAFAKAHNPPERTATAIGFINGIVTGAGALFQPAIGLALDLSWDGTIRDGVRIYSADDYRPALSLLLIGLAAAWFAARKLREPKAEALRSI
jgi:MFS family permease